MERSLIAFTGVAGCGKSTAAEYVASKYGFEVYGFAYPLKRMVGELFGFSEEQLFGPSQCRNAPDSRYPRADGTFLTPREALQTFGAEAGRKCYQNIWVEACMRYAQGKKLVLADLRYDNEAQAVRAAGGMVIEILRQGSLSGKLAAHSSEAGISPGLVSLRIHNDSTKGGLYSALDRVFAPRIAPEYLGDEWDFGK